MQKEILSSCQVPGKDGTIGTPGWAKSEFMQYTRENIQAPWYRKKEWDYYLITNEDFGLAFTISDLGYIGLLSASFLDFRQPCEHTESELVFFPKGQMFGLGVSAEDAHAECHTKRLDMVFSNAPGDPGKRHISCNFRNFHGEKHLTAELDLYRVNKDAMYICTPWKEKPTAFYYDCKMNCLEAEGTAAYGDRQLVLHRETSSGVLDWGRGVWTYDNTWCWGTGSGRIHNKASGHGSSDEEVFGFNLGYGFSDRSSCSENMLFYKEKVHKLSEITFNIPKKGLKNQYMEPWDISSDDGHFEARFVPIIDRSARMNFGIILSDQHQVFGKLSGAAVTTDGEIVQFNDFLCALEVVRNKY